ncbi:MAG: hypothetical protein HY261_08700 [Chloroflexi bacterium]|nr:hypothetical protein [Chloroflexota bacterium]
MDWRKRCGGKLVSAEVAVLSVRDGDMVVVPVGSDPKTVMTALLGRAPDLNDVRLRLYNGLNDLPWFEPDISSHIMPEVWFIVGPYVREQMQQRRGDTAIGACTLSTKGARDNRPDVRRPDVLLIELSPPDERGLCSFGPVRWDKKELAEFARVVIGEVNPSFIRTRGDNDIHVSEVDFLVEMAVPPTPFRKSISEELARKDVDALKAIAAHVAPLIRDRDTVLMGAGSTIEALPLFGMFDGRRDLGWHTERMPRGAIAMMRDHPERFTGKYKSLDRGKHVMTLLALTDDDTELANMHPDIELHSVHYVNDIRVIAAQENLVAIMNALAIDLTGQVASEHIGTRLHAGPGGQPEIAVGATLAKNGRSVMVLESTAQGGKVSRIAPQFEAGTVVTVTRAFVDYVVTEYGVASLLGKSARQRAEALIGIAHPKFRDELTREAKRLFWP